MDTVQRRTDPVEDMLRGGVSGASQRRRDSVSHTAKCLGASTSGSGSSGSSEVSWGRIWQQSPTLQTTGGCSKRPASPRRLQTSALPGLTGKLGLNRAEAGRPGRSRPGCPPRPALGRRRLSRRKGPQRLLSSSLLLKTICVPETGTHGSQTTLSPANSSSHTEETAFSLLVSRFHFTLIMHRSFCFRGCGAINNIVNVTLSRLGSVN